MLLVVVPCRSTYYLRSVLLPRRGRSRGKQDKINLFLEECVTTVGTKSILVSSLGRERVCSWRRAPPSLNEEQAIWGSLLWVCLSAGRVWKKDNRGKNVVVLKEGDRRRRRRKCFYLPIVYAHLAALVEQTASPRRRSPDNFAASIKEWRMTRRDKKGGSSIQYCYIFYWCFENSRCHTILFSICRKGFHCI